MSWFWANIPLMVVFFGLWAGIPLWYTLTRWRAELNAKHAALALAPAAATAAAPAAVPETRALAYAGAQSVNGN
jgi:hypothetical protein